MTIAQARTKRERRAELVGEAGKILEKAHAEDRDDLTPFEDKKWTDLHAEAEKLLSEAEALEANAGISLHDGAGGERNGFGRLKALRRDRSFAEQMRRPEDREIERQGGVGALVQRRAMGVGTDTAGGFLVGGGQFGTILDLLRSKNRVIESGAQMIPIRPEDEHRPVLTSEPAATHHAEHEPVPEGDLQIGRYTFSPRTIVTPIVRCSVELFEDARGLSQLLNNSFAQAIAAGVDTAALVGQADGNMKSPRGLSETPGVGETAMGSVAMDYDSLIDGRSAILTQDGPEPNAVIHSVAQDTAFAKLVDGEGNTLPKPPAIQNIAFAPTTRLTDRAFLGRWSHLHVLFRNSMNVSVKMLEERYMDNLQYGFIAWFRYDIVVERPEAFHQFSGVAT